MSTPDAVWEWISPSLELLRQAYKADPGKPWQELRQAFLSQLGLQSASESPVVEQLLRRLDEGPEEERNRILGSDELDSMAHKLVQQHAASQEAAGGDGAGYDEQAWQAYLAENGPQWDGTEENWDQFRQWFAYYAAEQGLNAPATAFLDYLTPQPAAQRIATFAQYGVTIAPAQEAAGGDGAGYDEQAWHAYLAENGPQWDGTEENWDQFRQWFAYYAAEQGLNAPATAFLDYLTAQHAAQRIATFAQYGVIITPAQEADGGEEAALSQEQIDAIADELLAENPEFEDIPEERRKEIIDEVRNELMAP